MCFWSWLQLKCWPEGFLPLRCEILSIGLSDFLKNRCIIFSVRAKNVCTWLSGRQFCFIIGTDSQKLSDFQAVNAHISYIWNECIFVRQAMCYKSYFKNELHFFSFLLGKKFPGLSVLVKHAAVLILIPSILLQTDAAELIRRAEKKTCTSVTQFKSLPVHLSACISLWNSALQQGLYH